MQEICWEPQTPFCNDTRNDDFVYDIIKEFVAKVSTQ